MNEDEADAFARDLVADIFGLDEFQRIAAAALLDDLGSLDMDNMTPEQERILMELGALVSEGWGPDVMGTS